MFEDILLCTFESIVKVSLGMIPFLAILLLLENAFRKQYSAIWKYHLFFLVLLRLITPVHTGKGEFLTIGNFVPKMEVTVIHDIKKSEEKKEVETEKELNVKKEPEKMQTYVIPNIPDIATLSVPTVSNISKNSFLLQGKNAKKTLTYFWFFVVITKIVYLMVQYVLFYKNIIRWRMLPCQKKTLEIYHTICQEMKIKEIPSLFVCHSIPSPMCFGFFQKGIYLTKEKLPEQEIKMIVQHELCHYQRKDLIYQFLCVMVSTFHFFNPFVLAFVKIAERDIELSCDDIVMEYCSKEKRKQYSTMLLEMMKESKNVLSNNFVRKEKWMKKRFENILDTTPKKKGTLLLWLLAILYLFSNSFSMFVAKQQLTLLFYIFNLFILSCFCFVMKIKEKKKMLLCVMLVLCLSVNGLLVGCSQNITSEIEKESNLESKEYSKEEIERLFQWKTEYVGDNSAVGNLLSELGTPDGIKRNGFEIQSHMEPYGIIIYDEIEDLSKVEQHYTMQIRKNTMVLFSLIGNLEYVNYHISQNDKEKTILSFTKEGMISEGEIVLTDSILEGYTDSADSYRYFLEAIEKTDQNNTSEQWKTEIENDLDTIVNQKKVESDTQVYLDSAQENYNRIIEKGEQALYYLLEEFEKGNAKGLRGEVMRKVCQEILQEKIGELPNTTPPKETEEWHENYQENYYDIYPYYSSIVENVKIDDAIIMSNIKEVFTEIEKKYQNKGIKMMSMLFFSPVNGLQHQYDDVVKINYYVKVNCNHFMMLEQNRGKILYLTGSSVMPVKISFEQKDDVVTLKDVQQKENESLETFCAEDKEMASWMSRVDTSEFPSFLDNLEQELKEYVSVNDIKVEYYCIDGKTVIPF